MSLFWVLAAIAIVVLVLILSERGNDSVDDPFRYEPHVGAESTGTIIQTNDANQRGYSGDQSQSAATHPVFNTILSSQLPFSSTTALSMFQGPAVQSPSAKFTADTVPASFDPRTTFTGLVGEPFDQLQCGSCWAFGCAQSLADRIRIFSKQGTSTATLHLNQSQINSSFYDETDIVSTTDPVLVGQINYRGASGFLDTLSPYYLAGCDVCNSSATFSPDIAEIFSTNNLCGTCCSGAVVEYAFLYILLNGIIQVSCDNDPESYTCSDNLGCPLFRPKSIYKVGLPGASISAGAGADPAVLLQNQQAIVLELANNGPIATSFLVYDNFDNFDTTKVYDQTSANLITGHCIVILGYGTGGTGISGATNVDYWICRNSWSQAWGNQGFFNIARGVNLGQIEGNCFAAEPFQVYDLSRLPVDTTAPVPPIATSCSPPSNNEVIVVNPLAS
jgi:hypothetical protein